MSPTTASAFLRLTQDPTAWYISSVVCDNYRGFVTTSPEKRATTLLKRAGIAHSGDLERAGLSRSQIRHLLGERLIERVARGLYRLPDAPLTERHDLAVVAQQVPDGVVCLLSALRFHGLTTQNPFEVWLAIS